MDRLFLSRKGWKMEHPQRLKAAFILRSYGTPEGVP